MEAAHLSIYESGPMLAEHIFVGIDSSGFKATQLE
jgi:hypothetical protein